MLQTMAWEKIKYTPFRSSWDKWQTFSMCLNSFKKLYNSDTDNSLDITQTKPV